MSKMPWLCGGTAILAAAIFLSAITAFATPTPAIAQSGERECVDLSRQPVREFFKSLLEFKKKLPPTENRVTVSAIDFRSPVRDGCAIKAKDAVIGGYLRLKETSVVEADFSGARFTSRVDFTSAQFPDGANFKGATFTDLTSFRGAVFGGEADFERAVFERGVSFQGAKFSTGASFKTARFDGERVCRRGREFRLAGPFVNFGNAEFTVKAIFDDSMFSSCVDFGDARFNTDASFRRVGINGDATFSGTTFARSVDFGQTFVQGNIILGGADFLSGFVPPAGLQGATDLRWDDVKHTFPGGDRTNWLGALENFFASGGQYDSATDVRTARRRLDLRIFVYSLPAGFLGVLLVFVAAYSLFLRVGRRGTRARHIGKLFLFSLDVITPGIGPWRHDWGGNEAFPVERVAALSAAESAIGWVILALGSAVFVAWIVA